MPSEEAGDLGMVARNLGWLGEGGSSAGIEGEAAATVATMVADGVVEGSDAKAEGTETGFGLAVHWV